MKINFNINYFVSAIIILMALMSASALVANKGFFFSEFGSQVKVKLESTNDKNKDELFDDLTNSQDVARVERENSIIYFQYQSEGSINSMIQEKLSEKSMSDVNAIVTRVSGLSLESTVQNYLTAMLIAFIAFFAGLYIFVFRKDTTLNQLLIYTVKSAISVALSVLLYLGLLSLVSRIYMVKLVDIGGIYIIYFWILAILFLAAYELERKDVDNLAQNFLEALKNYSKISVTILLIILPLITFGFGVEFVMPAVIIFLSFTLTSAAIVKIFEVEELTLPEFNFKRKASTKVATEGKKKAKKRKK